ncbi:hypothetical protein GCM10008090_23970 [Arenicella chitinivorans]|uniref:Thioesterase family protein n=1 Tax=Arenicella chitinivorans TaxID=1329800 RepID=A0A918VPG3_9GAMM|nr:hypothetical protein [Arenicella chitinivorans]GHA13440.1 hypothetical protein GCM10008090_23970 [Arenicella chitinivorans]
MQSQNIVIGRRYNGPPDSANGGYTAGLLARELNGPVQVRLVSPPPLETPLRLEADDLTASLFHDDALIATAAVCQLESSTPQCPDKQSILNAKGSYPNSHQHQLASCFVCGPARDPSDGLAIFPVAFDDYGVGSLWRPNQSVQDEAGQVPTEILWAALDCPGYFAHRQTERLMLLGSMSAEVFIRPKADQTFTVCGWQTKVDGRKFYSTTAIFDQQGLLCGKSEQIWFTLRTDNS